MNNFLKHKKLLCYAKTSAGFTLAEILIAITLLSFLMIGVYELMDNSTNTKESIIREDREMLQVESALARLNMDFTQIYTPLYFSFSEKEKKKEEEKKEHESDKENPEETKSRNEDRYADKEDSDEKSGGFQVSEKFPQVNDKGLPIPSLTNPDKNSIVFFTSSNQRKMQNVKQSRFAWVRYSLRNSTREDKKDSAPYEFVRSFTANNPYSGEFDWDPVPAHVLLRNVKSLEFLFWHKARSKFVSSLKELDDTSKIRILKIKLTWVDSIDLEHDVERTFRAQWPYFDPKIDMKKTKDTKKDDNIDEKSDDKKEKDAA